MGKNLTRLVILGMLLASGYFLLNQESVASYTIPFIELTKKGKAKIYESNFASSTISKLTGQASEAAGQFVSNIIDDTKAEVFRVIKGTVNKKVDSIGADLGIGIAKEIESPVMFSIKTGVPAYFTIDNKENSALRYEVNWQDGKIERGEITGGQSKILSHSWLRAGQYQITFRVSDKERSKEYAVSVSIF